MLWRTSKSKPSTRGRKQQRLFHLFFDWGDSNSQIFELWCQSLQDSGPKQQFRVSVKVFVSTNLNFWNLFRTSSTKSTCCTNTSSSILVRTSNVQNLRVVRTLRILYETVIEVTQFSTNQNSPFIMPLRTRIFFTVQFLLTLTSLLHKRSSPSLTVTHSRNKSIERRTSNLSPQGDYYCRLYNTSTQETKPFKSP